MDSNLRHLFFFFKKKKLIEVIFIKIILKLKLFSHVFVINYL
jgi:hypothetical protein